MARASACSRRLDQYNIESLERCVIVEALEACGGNQRLATQDLGISRGTLLSPQAVRHHAAAR